MSELTDFDRKQTRIPVLHNRLILADRYGKWRQSSYADGVLKATNPNTIDFRKEIESEVTCGTTFCAAGWAAQDAGYVPTYAPIGNGEVLICNDYVKLGQVRDLNKVECKTENPQIIAREYLGLTTMESWFLFETASCERDIDRFTAMLRIVKDGNPTDFGWLHSILYDRVEVPKAELLPIS